jgi:hypothetical protein
VLHPRHERPVRGVVEDVVALEELRLPRAPTRRLPRGAVVEDVVARNLERLRVGNRPRRRRVLLGKVVVLRDGTAAEREDEGMSAWVSAGSNATATEGRGGDDRRFRITGGERTFGW